jgi:hypothetical protein
VQQNLLLNCDLRSLTEIYRTSRFICMFSVHAFRGVCYITVRYNNSRTLYWLTLKGKFLPITCHAARKESRSIAQLCANFCARWSEWSAPRFGCFTPGKEPRYPKTRLDGFWRKPLAPTGVRTPVHSARSEYLTLVFIIQARFALI